MTITIPTSIEDITLGQYVALSKIPTDNRTAQVAILCKIDEKDVKRMEKSSLDEITAFLDTIEYTDEDKYDWKRFVVLNGRKYGFHPNLSEMSVGEFVDLETLARDPMENLSRIMAILYRPVIEEAGPLYKVARYTGDEDHEPMNDLPLDVVLGTLNFFLLLGVNFVKTSVPSLK